MLNSRNRNFLIKYGPSSIHDDHIAHGIHQESTAKSLTITPDHIDRIWPTATTLDKRHMIANHYDRMSDKIKAKIDESETLSRHACEYVKDPEKIHQNIDSGDFNKIHVSSHNENLNQDHISKILDHKNADEFAYGIANHKLSDENFDKFLAVNDHMSIALHLRTHKLSPDRLKKIIDQPNIHSTNRMDRIGSIGIHQDHFDVQSYINGKYRFGRPISQVE